ncbi:MAG: hypothetical protein OEQ53_11920 [Saprospiraceae bacterium]|nr:hypothetical protein [Saprospiraceae bacterium]
MSDHKSEKDRDELREFLKDLPRENPFVVPHNYFKDLPNAVLDRIREEDEKRKSPSFWEQLESWWMSKLVKPALALIVFIAVGVYILWPTEYSVDLMTTELTEQEIRNYVIHNLDEFEEDFFYLSETEGLDILSESFGDEEVEILWEELIEDLDAETLQNIL